MKRVESALPISKTFLRRKSLRHSYHALGVALAHRAPYGACTHGWGSSDPQSPVVDQHKLLLREIHSKMRSSHPFDEA
jgi:hypothetical protein